MKKTYLAPQVLIVEVKGQQILAGSDVSSTGLSGFNGYGGVDTNGTKDPSSRHNNGWWDDEDEDW